MAVGTAFKNQGFQGIDAFFEAVHAVTDVLDESRLFRAAPFVAPAFLGFPFEDPSQTDQGPADHGETNHDKDDNYGEDDIRWHDALG